MDPSEDISKIIALFVRIRDESLALKKTAPTYEIYKQCMIFGANIFFSFHNFL